MVLCTREYLSFFGKKKKSFSHLICSIKPLRGLSITNSAVAMSSAEPGWEAVVGTGWGQQHCRIGAGAGDVSVWAVAEMGSGAVGLELGSAGV